jgi:hypothetical protein
MLKLSPSVPDCAQYISMGRSKLTTFARPPGWPSVDVYRL